MKVPVNFNQLETGFFFSYNKFLNLLIEFEKFDLSKEDI